MKNDKTSIQDKVKQLDKVVEWFQGDDFKLEDAKTMLKKAADLANDIERDLKAIANDVNEVKKSFTAETDA